MGGQACVFYGAAEFSRDVDFAILADAANVSRLRGAFKELLADVIAVPEFGLRHLRAGHAVHFRCQHPDALRMRVDVMSTLRGVDPFSKLWKRRSSLELPDGTRCDLLSLPDLVQAKKTQRDKDWPMIRRLVEANYFQNIAKPNADQIRFWFRELRTTDLLLELAHQYPAVCRRLKTGRPLLAHAERQDLAGVESSLAVEEATERREDRAYWLPLRKELEALRHAR